MSLDFAVFQHSYEGFNGTSTLFYGEQDAVLIDATQLLSDAHRLAADLLLTGKNLTHVYISHFHPDHHFGVGVLQQTFPHMRVVALPSVVKDIIFTTDEKVHLWGDVFGNNVPDTVVFPMPLAEGRLEVEGQVIEFSDDWDGDSANNTMIWVPSLGRCLRDRHRLQQRPRVDGRERCGPPSEVAGLAAQAAGDGAAGCRPGPLQPRDAPPARHVGHRLHPRATSTSTRRCWPAPGRATSWSRGSRRGIRA